MKQIDEEMISDENIGSLYSGRRGSKTTTSVLTKKKKEKNEKDKEEDGSKEGFKGSYIDKS